MSRSRKKTPICKVGIKGMKQCANKRVRRLLKNQDIDLQHGAYKKYFEQYDICDQFYFGDSFESFYERKLERWNAFWKYYKEKPTREDCIKEYKKFYIRK